MHEAIRREGEAELARTPSALAWSGLAAGLSMGASLMAEGLLQAHLPAAAWSPLLTKLGYCVGFLVVILGRQQLFTENTLTAILPLLANRDRLTVLLVGRLWGLVLATNLLGTLVFAAVAAYTTAFDPETRRAFLDIGRHAVSDGAGRIFLQAIFAGWLIALMVWLLPGAETGRLAVIVIITYLVGLGGFDHIVAGAVSVLYVALVGAVSWRAALAGWMAPTLIGNVVGGVALVSALNHAQVVAGQKRNAGAK